jgi:hypothetical protein
MPSTVQYPLERHRDVERRWGWLLQRVQRSNADGNRAPRNKHQHVRKKSAAVRPLHVSVAQ